MYQIIFDLEWGQKNSIATNLDLLFDFIFVPYLNVTSGSGLLTPSNVLFFSYLTLSGFFYFPEYCIQNYIVQFCYIFQLIFSIREQHPLMIDVKF